MSFRITILGSGTSTGVPVIGCDCPVCTSQDPKDHRTRASILVTSSRGKNIVIDTTPEFRLQMLSAKVKKLEAVIYTHVHADHCHGFDDLRAFYFYDRTPLNCYIGEEHLNDLKVRFAYAFQETGYLGTKPEIKAVTITHEPFMIDNLIFETLFLPHGDQRTYAFKIGRFAYATDFKYFEPQQIEQWRGKIDTMVASGIHFDQHPTHSNIRETIDLFNKLQVRRGIITHLSHRIDYKRDQSKLPNHVEFAFDGMVIDVS